MEIIKNKRKSKCSACGKQIEFKYKGVEWGSHYHLSCMRKKVISNLNYWKEQKKELGKKKYKKIIILENL